MMSFTLNTYENPYIVKAPDYSSIQVKKSSEMVKKKFKKPTLQNDHIMKLAIAE